MNELLHMYVQRTILYILQREKYATTRGFMLLLYRLQI